MLVKVFRRNSIATGRRLSCKGNVSFEDLMRGASDFDVRAVTVETLTSLRHLLPIAVDIAAVITTIRAAVLSCSHDTFCTDGEVGSLTKQSASKHVRCWNGSRRSSVQRQLFLDGTLDGRIVISKRFLAQCPQRPGFSSAGCRQLQSGVGCHITDIADNSDYLAVSISRTTPEREKASSRPSGNRHPYGCRGTPHSDAQCQAHSAAAQTCGHRTAD